jgi:hypothetical protein
MGDALIDSDGRNIVKFFEVFTIFNILQLL